MRDPRHPTWPRNGERTELRDVAERWKWLYVDWCHQKHRARTLGYADEQTFGPAMAAYLEHRSRTVEEATHANDRTALAHLADSFLATTPVERLDIQPVIDRLLALRYKPSSLVTYRHHIGSFLQWCGVPIPTSVIPNPGKGDVQPLTDAEVRAVRDAAHNPVAVDLGLFMGLRQSEIFAVQGTDIDVSEWTVRVQRQMPKTGTTPKPLKGKKARTALILPGWQHPPIAGRMVEWVSRRHQHKMIRDTLDDAGVYVQGMGWHVLRHTYARIVLESGGTLEQLKSFLGHHSIRTTEQTYGHYSPDMAASQARQVIHRR